MKKTVLTLTLSSIALLSSFVPGSAEALKVRVEPSIVVAPVHERVHYRPARRVVRPAHREVYYDPYTGVSYIQEYPGYVEYRPAVVETRHWYTPFLNFNFRFW